MVGTHRIVNKDVSFKDLGLLVIDEEQKFGVKIKDRLKEIKVNVDTLTLTATPIPRTLAMTVYGDLDTGRGSGTAGLVRADPLCGRQSSPLRRHG